MSQPKGRNLRLSLPRRFICDLLHFARQVPTVPVQRRMNLAAVVRARQEAAPRPSWAAIFAKAYAFVCAAHPELRRSYLSFPAPHLYEHPVGVASIAVERRVGDEEAVLFGHVTAAEQHSLTELDLRLRAFKEQPLEKIGAFRHVLRLGAWPRPLRRLAWWFALNVFGRKRAHFLGTFGVSVYAGLGAASLHPLSPLTTTLNYGVIDADGGVDVRLIYDHRVMDGATVARALQDLERVLQCEIVAELRYLRAVEAA
jgi:pyruvate/2-oxoglutarate dehydrogenase complex dihydrolipoamide acyltransferase (E2) component